MARNLVPIGEEFQVNLLDPLPRSPPQTENGVVGFQGFLSNIALLDNGNFVVVYPNDAGGSGDEDILSVEFTPDGKVAHTPFRVDFDAGGQSRPDVAPRIGGGYVAVWEEDSDDSIHLVAVTSATPTNPPEFTVDNPAESLSGPSIATFANGTHIVTYTDEMASSDDVWFAIVNANGDGFVKTPTGLVTTISVDENSARVATSGNVAAVVFTKGEFSADIGLSIVNSNGTGVDFEIVADISGATALPDVAALSDGRFVIVWDQIGASADVMGRIYNPATGDFSGPAFVVTTGANDELLPRVVGLPDGGFVVTWTDIAQMGSAAFVHGRRFDSSGAPAGDAFLLSDTKGQEITSIDADKAGRVFVAWATGPNEHTTDPDIGQDGNIFRSVTETVNGTEANDTITTYSLAEPINGLGGKDTIDARAGNDVVSGGEGKDTLTGGPGFDAFLFDVKPKNKNADHLTDFTLGVDKLRLDHDIFKKLDVGDLPGKAFFAHKHADEAKDHKDHIVYDSKSGELWYDKDGKGGADAKLIAVLDGAPDLGHSDIVVVA